jgi:adenine-specific DNA-methyltransferase
MKPYYSDDLVTLYHGRCEDVLPTLSLSGSVHLLTDPPYFKVKDNDWDNQWSKSAEFLGWMGEWLDLAKPHLSPDASVWVFASPQLTTAVESVVASRFRVLNSVRWEKSTALTNKNDHTALRKFLPQWEGIIFAEQFADAYGDQAQALHKQVFAPLGRYLQTEWERAGWKAGKLGPALGYDSAMGTRWAEGASLPTADAYQRLRALLNGPDSNEYLRREFEDLRREFEDLRREFEDLRRPFSLTARTRWADQFRFDSVPAYPGKHNCEKPVDLLAHMIETTTRPGDTIIDCFAGSGAVLDVARQLGRKAIGIEMDKHWCGQIAKRLSQQSFDLGAIA